MGATVCATVLDAADCELVAAVDPNHAGERVAGTDLETAAGPDALLDAGAEVSVDFTVVSAARENLRWCAAHDVHAVVGTTGITEDDLDELTNLFGSSRANAFIAPNFAIGAVLMMRFAEQAAPWFETAEIVELHHDRKVDAPSGTSMQTAHRMAAASREWAEDPTRTVVAEGARGGLVDDAIRVHSVRMRGMLAHQEVILGTTGETLTIRHDSYDRSSFMPGVLLAVRRVAGLPSLTVGLDALLDA
jgi:4-hydroxy-tetrahydrodipicolinate reductase